MERLLAAGVSVPPNAALRDAAHYVVYGPIRFAVDAYVDEQAQPVMVEQLAALKQAVDALAGVGEARPAEPPTERQSEKWRALYYRALDHYLYESDPAHADEDV